MKKMWYEYDPLLRHEQTFGELCDKLTTAEVFKGTSVDVDTQAAIRNFFELDRLCDTEKRFLWLFRRDTNSWYSVYLDEKAMWEERKIKKWFYDNERSNRTTHDGTVRLDETTLNTLKAELNRAIKDVYAGTTSGTDHSETTGSVANTSHEESSGSNSDTATGKDRGFSFRYPESNYQGGVVPYDMDSDPSVEFIDAQSDKLTKNESSGTTESTKDGNGTSSESSITNGNTSGKDDHTNDSTTTETSGHTANGTRGQDTTTHWTETEERRGDNINDLARELIEMLPTTNFFLKFMDHLKPCFQSSYLVDEMEVLENDEYF